MNTNCCPAYQRRAVRTALGMEIWNFAESVALSAMFLLVMIDANNVK